MPLKLDQSVKDVKGRTDFFEQPNERTRLIQPSGDSGLLLSTEVCGHYIIHCSKML